MIAAICLSLLSLAPLQDGLKPEVVKAIDHVFQRWSRRTSPGCVVAVYKDGRMQYGKGFGAANLEHRIPITTETVFRIASTTKQFTAACVVLLELDGELSFRDDISKWIPELPPYSDAILVEDLVHHTSGLREYLDLLAWAGHSDDAEIDAQTVFDLVTRQRGLNHRPGEEYAYTNTGYFLLSILVERISGDSLRAFAQRRIFDPLGMQHTFYNDDADEVIPKRATGYERGWLGEAFRISETRLEVIGDGGVFTTAEDLLRWDANFYEPRLGGQTFLNRMLAPAVLRTGDVLDYASGLSVQTWRSKRVVSHGGAFVGFRSQLMRFPDEHTTILCLSNRADFEANKRCEEVAEILFDDLTAPSLTSDKGPRRPRPVPEDKDPLPAPEPDLCAGAYSSDELGVTWQLRAAGPHLYIDGIQKKPVRFSTKPDGTYRGGGAHVRFFVDEQGHVARFTISCPTARGIEFTRDPD